MKDPLAGHQVYFEYVPVGTSVKVSAVDAVTGLEVSIVAPATASQDEMNRIALNKLRYMTRKREG